MSPQLSIRNQFEYQTSHFEAVHTSTESYNFTSPTVLEPGLHGEIQWSQGIPKANGFRNYDMMGRIYLYVYLICSLVYELLATLDAIERSYSTVVVLCTYGEHFPALCKGPEFEPRWDQLVLLVFAWDISQYVRRGEVEFGVLRLAIVGECVV